MYETEQETAALQELLDSSRGGATEHLRSIIDDNRSLTARDLVALLTGMRVITLATVTATGEPRVSAVDGHFLHGTWSFGTSGTSAKARHLEARPAISIAHVDGERMALFAHGTAQRLRPTDADWEPTLAHWTAHYGTSPLSWGDDIRMYLLRPHWMVGYVADREALLAERSVAGE